VIPHVPAEHVADPVPDVGPEQTVVQAPQWLVSVCRLSQELTPATVQSVAVPWQLQLLPALLQHAPLLHWPQPLTPQAPQLLVSLWRFLQLPLQQLNPAAQTFPHAPQLLLSFVVSTQVPQQCVPLVQTQAPPEQVLPAPQTVPQVPQLFESVSTLVHVPLQLV
jgi:hypothetical protein